MQRYWQLEYKQETEEDGKLKIVSDWGRIGKRFGTLEELLKYVADELCSYDELKKKPLLEVDAKTLEVVGVSYYDVEEERLVEAPREGRKSVKVVTTAKAFYLEEDEARVDDYLQMKDYVEVQR